MLGAPRMCASAEQRADLSVEPDPVHVDEVVAPGAGEGEVYRAVCGDGGRDRGRALLPALPAAGGADGQGGDDRAGRAVQADFDGARGRAAGSETRGDPGRWSAAEVDTVVAQRITGADPPDVLGTRRIFGRRGAGLDVPALRLQRRAGVTTATAEPEPIAVDEVGTAGTSEHLVDALDAGDRVDRGHGGCAPLLPAAGVRHGHLRDQRPGR